jgi:hypothetical protein
LQLTGLVRLKSKQSQFVKLCLMLPSKTILSVVEYLSSLAKFEPFVC